MWHAWVIEPPYRILAGVTGRCDKLIENRTFLGFCGLLIARSDLLQQLLFARENSCMTSLLDPPLCDGTVLWVTLLVMQPAVKVRSFVMQFGGGDPEIVHDQAALEKIASDLGGAAVLFTVTHPDYE
jgi:hypothetical protein